MGDTSGFFLDGAAVSERISLAEDGLVPWTPLKKPLSQAEPALVSSAGFVMPDQPSF